MVVVSCLTSDLVYYRIPSLNYGYASARSVCNLDVCACDAVVVAGTIECVA